MANPQATAAFVVKSDADHPTPFRGQSARWHVRLAMTNNKPIGNIQPNVSHIPVAGASAGPKMTKQSPTATNQSWPFQLANSVDVRLTSRPRRRLLRLLSGPHLLRLARRPG